MEKYLRQGYSQNGEEGVIEEIMNRIGVKVGFFVDVGAYDGVQMSNTFALAKKGWGGIEIEANPQFFPHLEKNLSPYPNVQVINQRITCEPGENLNEILHEHQVPKVFDFLNIDVDSIDYWIWNDTEAMPKLVVVEYNSNYEPHESVSMPYIPDHDWTHRDTYYGASALAFDNLARGKGYTLIFHTDKVNLFFVRDDFAALFPPYPVEKVKKSPIHPPTNRRMIRVGR
jgi:hypothetical protein